MDFEGAIDPEVMFNSSSINEKIFALMTDVGDIPKLDSNRGIVEGERLPQSLLECLH